MTIFDYAVLAILLVSITVSVLRGLVREILSLIGWIAAFVVATLYAEDFAPALAVLPSQIMRVAVAFMLILVAMALVMAMINWGVMRGVEAAGLQLADRGLGGLFGLARGLVIVIALVLVAGMTSLPRMTFWKEAVFSPLAETAVLTIRPWLPAAIADKVKF